MRDLVGIVNSNSGGYHIDKFRVIHDTLQDMNSPCFLLTNDRRDLGSAVEAVMKEKPQYLVIGGGTGTLSFVLTELANRYEIQRQSYKEFPNIVYVPMGTQDRIGRELGIFLTSWLPQLKAEQASSFFAKTMKGIANRKPLRTEKMGLMRIELDRQKDKVRYGFDFGFGLVSSWLMLYYGIKPEEFNEDMFRELSNKPVARRSLDISVEMIKEALRQASYTIFSGEHSPQSQLLGSVPCTVYGESNRMLIDKQTVLLFYAATSKYLGMGFEPMYMARKDPTKMHLLATWMSLLELVSENRLRNFLSLRYGLPFKGDKLKDISTGKITVEFGRKIVVQIAGELHDANYAEVTVPRYVEFVVPKGSMPYVPTIVERLSRI